MFKRFLISILTVCFIVLSVNNVSAATAYNYEKLINLKIGEKNAVVNGSNISLDASAYVKNGRTLVPLRFVGEELGANVVWDEKTKTATLTLNQTNIKVTVKSPNAYINGKLTILDVMAETKNMRLFVPLRFIGEAFGADVSFDNGKNIVKVVLIDKINWKTLKYPEKNIQKYYPTNWSGEIKKEDSCLYFKSPLGTEIWFSKVTEKFSDVINSIKETAKSNGYELTEEQTSKDGKNKNLKFLNKNASNQNETSMYLVNVQVLNDGSVVVDETMTKVGIADIDMPVVTKILLSTSEV